MCERPPKRLTAVFCGTALLTVFQAVLFNLPISAQGGDGRSGSVAARTSSGVHRIARRSQIPKRSVPAARNEADRTGRLSIVVNEGGSRVYLSPVGSGQESELATDVHHVPLLIVRVLPAGLYKVVVRKPGFFEETRVVDIHADKRRKVVMNLRPQMAVLTVNTNLADSEIQIAGVGTFKGSVKKLFVKPGNYTVAVQRRGYLSQTATVNLKMAGREQNLSIVLQPMPIEMMLALAAEELTRGDLEFASARANDVLLLNPNHAKANLLYAKILLARGDPGSAIYFEKAIGGSETVSLPIKILEGPELIDAELRIDRGGLSFQSRERVDLNFTIRKADILEIRRSVNSESPAAIVIKGRSDFHGRPIEPHLTIYSRLAVISGAPPTAGCPTAPSGRSCATDAEIILKVINDWLAL